jgi:hypothetical protein
MRDQCNQFTSVTLSYGDKECSKPRSRYLPSFQKNQRPPLDNVNCLLSFLYTLLLHDVRSALEGVELDPAVGFCTATDRAAPDLRWISWKRSVRSWQTGRHYPSSIWVR